MHTRTALGLLAGAALLLTGCSSSAGHDTPAHSTTAATVQAAPTTTAAPDKAALIRACVDAIAAGKDDGVPGAPECTSLPTADYYEAVHEANEAAQKAFQDDTNNAASATP